MPSPSRGDADYGAGAAWYRLHRRLVATAAVGFIVCIGLAIWLGQISDVNDTPGSSGRAGAVITLVREIPKVALDSATASALAVTLARTYSVVAVLTIGCAIASGVAWFRADRLRKPLGRDSEPRHLR